MKWIDKLGRALNQNFNARSINILVVLGISILYMWLIDLIIKSTFLSDKIESSFNLIFTILSPISLANYYYNKSKFEAAEIGKIRIIIILMCAVFWCFNFCGWLHEYHVVDSPFSYMSKPLWIILIVCYLTVVQSESAVISKLKTPLLVYMSAHLFWILTLFFMVSSRLNLNYKETIFTKANLIILLVLISIAVTYSLTQQYFYKRLTKSKDIKEVSKKLMSEIINLK